LLDRLPGRTLVAGNVGDPLLDVLDAARTADRVVLEVSSYQLAQSAGFHPHIALLLNLAPDHLDYHGGYAGYIAAKRRLFLHLTKEDRAIVPRRWEELLQGCPAWRIAYDEQRLPAISGRDELVPHQRANLQAALAVCRAVEPAFDPRRIAFEDLATAFRGAHRLEPVGCYHGVRVINDSKSTNAASACAALAAIPGPVVLLLGGRHKNGGYDALACCIAGSDVRHIVVFGEAAAYLEAQLGGVAAGRLTRTPTLHAAIAAAWPRVRNGDALLLSPACSSFDEFADYQERGTAFSSWVRSLAASPPR
jgi:UDP-N-acetylmuramoylalanine--D-glutamate ligase